MFERVATERGAITDVQANGVHPASHLHRTWSPRVADHLAVTVPKSTTPLSLPHNSERPSQGAFDLIKVRIRGAISPQVVL